eukprot:Sdes_comp9828_c0_seq1m1366
MSSASSLKFLLWVLFLFQVAIWALLVAGTSTTWVQCTLSPVAGCVSFTLFTPMPNFNQNQITLVVFTQAVIVLSIVFVFLHAAVLLTVISQLYKNQAWVYESQKKLKVTFGVISTLAWILQILSWAVFLGFFQNDPLSMIASLTTGFLMVILAWCLQTVSMVGLFCFFSRRFDGMMDSKNQSSELKTMDMNEDKILG